MGEDRKTKRRGIFLSLSQIVVLWLVIVVTMVAVFFFGLSAGRGQGVQMALEHSGRESVRLPLIDPALVNRALEESAEELETQVASAGGVLATSDVAGVPGSSAATAGKLAEDSKAPTDLALGDKAKTDSIIGGGADAGFAKKSTPELLASNERMSDAAQQQVDPAAVAAEKKAALDRQLAAAKKVESEAKLAAAKKQQAIETAKIEASRLAARTPEPKLEVASRTTAASTAPAGQGSSRARLDDPITAPKKDSIQTGWYVQVRAAESSKEALELMRNLKKSSTPSLIQMATVGNKVYYRVLVGPYSQKSPAQEKQKQIKQLALTKGDPFLKYIN